MKGLDLARAFYEECGLKMLEEQFPDILDKIAIGLLGSGSECYGYDDEISQDHDFEPGFCIFLPEESVVSEKQAFQLERAYNKLPREFRGYKRNLLNPVGGNRHGVFRAGEYFLEKTGSADGSLTLQQWFTTPDYVLSEATNGEIFRDDSELVTSIRKNLLDMPQDVFLKKLAGNVLVMSQSGQYNYNRCLKRQETAAAQLAINEFVRATMKVVFLLNRTYMPYYKWSFRAMRELPKLSVIAEILEYLLTSGNDEGEAVTKTGMIENVVSLITEELRAQDLSDEQGEELERHAYSINDRIEQNDIRNMDVFSAVM